MWDYVCLECSGGTWYYMGTTLGLLKEFVDFRVVFAPKTETQAKKTKGTLNGKFDFYVVIYS